MKAAFTVIQAVLILLVAVAMVTVTLPWAIDTVHTSVDMNEIMTIKSQFDVCSDRILETARTGTSNKCIFDIKNGKITGRREGVYYNLISNAPICDKSPMVEIDPRTHVWQECNISGSQRVFGMLWMFPKELNVSGNGVEGNKMTGSTSSGSIGFGNNIIFKTLSLGVDFKYNPGESGKIVEMSRINITNKNVTLSISIT
jgi:hypothetical protein